jgi:2,5-diketo-D-gluconate reductase A
MNRAMQQMASTPMRRARERAAPGLCGLRLVDVLRLSDESSDTGRDYRPAQSRRPASSRSAASGLDRDDVFVTSKLNNNHHPYSDALAAFDRTLSDLGLEYVDLFLIHWPLPAVGDFVETWRALESVYRDDRARAIGVSNFHAGHLRRLLDETELVPAVNQIEAHPYLTQEPLRAFNASHGIKTEAWSPLARGRVLDDPTIKDVVDRTGRTAAQVVLRWHIQLGNIVFPKSVRLDRIEENFNIFDFELSGEDMAAISKLDRGERTGPDPDTFNYVPD